MERYTLYCTPEQTKKALEFGTPLEEAKTLIEAQAKNHLMLSNDIGGIILPYIPTAEQMCNWLRKEKDIHVCPVYYKSESRNCEWYNCEMNMHSINQDTDYNTYEEAILAGIDAALEYLSQNKR